MIKSFNEIKKSIALLTLEIKGLDPTTKYSAIVHLEETVDLLKLEALKELPEEDIKTEDTFSNNVDYDDDDVDDDYDDDEDTESNTSNEPVPASEYLPVEKSLYNSDTNCDDDKTEDNHSNNSNANQELIDEPALASPQIGQSSSILFGEFHQIREEETSTNVTTIEIKEEPRSRSAEEEHPSPSETVVTVDEDDPKHQAGVATVLDIQTNAKIVDESLEESFKQMPISTESIVTKHICTICQKQFQNRFALGRHRNMHTGKYRCPTCKATFGRRRSLETHCESPENCLKVKNIRSSTVLPTEEDTNDDDDEETESGTSNEPGPTNDSLPVQKSLYNGDINCDDDRTEDNQSNNSSANQEPIGEPALALPQIGQASSILFGEFHQIGEEETSTNVSNDPSLSETVVTVNDYDENSKEFDCKICQKVLLSRRGLLLHYIIHKGKFQCPKCKAPFSGKRELDKHSTNHVNCLKIAKLRSYCDPLEFKIDASNPILNSTDYLFLGRNTSRPPLHSKDQEKPITPKPSFPCEPCNVKFSKPSKLKRHQEGRVHEEKVAKLAETLLTPNTETEVVSKDVPPSKPIALFKDKLLQCPNCPRLYSNESSLKKHLKEHSDEFKCSECGSRFGSPSSLEVHSCESTLRRRSSWGDVTTIGVALAECRECGMRFGGTTKGSGYRDSDCKKKWINFHKLEHTDKFKCPVCAHGFSSARILAKHTRNKERCKSIKSRRQTLIKRSRLLYSSPQESESMLEEKDTQPLASLTPQKLQQNKNTYVRPIKKGDKYVRPVNMIQCPKCPKLYANSFSLRSHMPIHTDKYKCPKCESRFVSPSMMAKHKCEATLKRRSAEAPATMGPAVAECLKCGMRFGKKRLMRYHKIEHTNEFKCHSCSFGFSSISALAQHLGNKERCKHIKGRREAIIKRSRLLFSSPPKSKRPDIHSDIEKLQLQKLIINSFDPAEDDNAKKADLNSEEKQAKASDTQSEPSDVKEPSTKDPTLVILNHNFPGITFHDS